MHGRWLAGQEVNPHASFHLICLPYAGGAASVFRAWRDVIPSHVHVCAPELPGHGRRMWEAPFMSMRPLVRDLANSLDALFEHPFALFGHSMGGLIAFELARALRELGRPQPAHLFISATTAPGMPRTRPMIHCATVEDVRKELRALNGTPEALLQDDDLLALLLPALQADFSLLDTYEYRAEPPLSVPITVFGGISDRAVPPAALTGWRQQSSRGCRLLFFPGDHFFLRSAAADLIRTISRTLDLETIAQY